MNSVKNTDMLSGPLAKKIILFTLPIALSSIIQQLFNAADTAIVGLFGNSDALAAVGTNTETVALTVTVSSGLSIGTNVLVANRIGKKRLNDIPSAVSTSVLLAAVIGIVFSAVCQLCAEPLLELIKTPDDIFSAAESYLRIYIIGIPFLLLYDFGAAVLRARGNSRYPFTALVISGAVNVALNLIFVAVFDWDVAGVSAATDISTAFAAFSVLRKLKKDGCLKPSSKKDLFGSEYVAEILKTGIPSAIQGAVFCFANIFVQAAVNRFGTAAIAGSAAAMNFEYFSYYIITAFCQTATTFTGQNYSAKQYGRCKKILLLCLSFLIISSLLTIVPNVIFRYRLSAIFSDDPTVIENAAKRIMCILLFEPLCNLFEIPTGTLRGTGHASLAAADTVIGTCVFRIVWIFTVFRAHPSLEVLYIAFPLSWVVTITLVAISLACANPFRSSDMQQKKPSLEK